MASFEIRKKWNGSISSCENITESPYKISFDYDYNDDGGGGLSITVDAPFFDDKPYPMEGMFITVYQFPNNTFKCT